MDPRVQKLFPDPKRLLTEGTNYQIPRSPSQLHAVYGRLKICVCMCVDSTQ